MEDLTGKRLGQYKIVAPLGEGGMAAVYKAYQQSMDRYVALKILPQHFAADPEFVGRFEQEARVIAKLQHVHILPVHDYGTAEGYTYIVMPFVETGTLGEILHGEPLPMDRIRKIISQVSRALHHAHSQGMVHRDVKPTNILIDQDGNCLLTDFGITKVVEGTTQFTQTGAILGTPAYMSPEQIKGEVLDGRSDIYSLGIILYEMATGRAPYRAETPPAIFVKHLHDPLPPPRTYNPDLPESVERVILKALAKDPQERFDTAIELTSAFDQATREGSREGTIIEPVVAPTPQTLIEDPAIETVLDEPPPVERVTPLPPIAMPDDGPPRNLTRWALLGVGGAIAVVVGFLGIRAILGSGATPTPEATSIPKATTPPAATEEAPTPTRVPTQDVSTPEGIPGGTIVVNAVDGAELVYIPEGEFTMGANPTEGYEFCLDFPPASGAECKVAWFEPESPPHEVNLSAFWIHKTEVTIAQYWQCVNADVCDPMDQKGRPTDHPVSLVDWNQAQTYCQWAGLDLPTEAQWEKAARGPADRIWPWGSERPTSSMLNTMESEIEDTVPVDSYPGSVSYYGLYGMSGNVWELVLDWYHEDYYKDPASRQADTQGPPSSPDGFRTLKGAGYVGDYNDARISRRLNVHPTYAGHHVGFRCAGSELPEGSRR
jgi:formylglycine-generating enzyme required for sulfatase activity/predicted Ser/Thr protein kinase